MSSTSRDPQTPTASPHKGSQLLSALGIFMFSFRQWMRENLPIEGAMTVSRAGVLLALANKRDRVGMSELGELSGLSPRSMTVLADGLEREGLIERVPHPSDRRVTLIGITEAGSVFVKRELGPSQETTASLFDDLSDAEQDELLRLLGKLVESCRTRGIDVPARRYP